MKNYLKKNADYSEKTKKIGYALSNLKKSLLIIVLIGFVSVSVHAQDSETRKGFIGISLGAALPMGEFNKKYCNTGMQFNVDFGYLFSKNIGISAALFGTDFAAKRNTKNSVGLSGLLVGPLFSTATSNGKIEFDFKPMAGFAQGNLYESNDDVSSSKTTFTCGGGAALRWNCWKRFALSGNVNYYYGKPETIDLSSLGIMVGVVYRLR
ncbi:MAG: porin family protein [Prevotellaceae bacterium]|jgi:hypothetical protein|nr:porin family protein [Prevotellaceae bacterium]